MFSTDLPADSPEFDAIKQAAAEYFKLSLEQLTGAGKARQVAHARQIAMYLAKQMTSRSLPEIGRRFGGRDHTTIMHGVKKIEELRSADRSLAEDIDLLRRLLEA